MKEKKPIIQLLIWTWSWVATLALASFGPMFIWDEHLPTVLLNIILAWNEAFWTINLTAANAAPLTAFITSYSSPEGLFHAKLSAASIMAIAPILVMGWFSQKQLVRGLTFGAVK